MEGIILSTKEKPFTILIDRKLESGHDFSDMSAEALKEFQKFLKETVYKKSTISEVEYAWKRKIKTQDFWVL